MSYTEVFGGNTIYPSDVSYRAVTLSANTTFEWPLEASTSANLIARIMDITPTGAYVLSMPDATLTGNGQTTLFNNLGPYTIILADNTGGTLASIAPGEQWEVYLTDNTTAAGDWRVFRFGASTAQAQASALAGYGIKATGSTLSQSNHVSLFNSNYTMGTADRSYTYVWTGALGTLSLPSASSVGNDWFASVRNGGSGNLTIDPSGSELINGSATLTLAPGDSATIVTDGTSWYTVGYGQQAVFAFDYTSVSLTGSGTTYTLAGSELNRISYDFVGTLSNNVEVVVPSTVQQYWIANDTTGGSYLVGVRTSTQTPALTIPRGARGIYYCNGSSVIKADTASIATPISLTDGGTGATTAGAALINLGGTATGIGVFTASTATLARTALGAAASGANTDITSLAGSISITAPGSGSTLSLAGVASGTALSITNGTAGSGSEYLQSWSNGTDSNLFVRLSQVGAASKFSAIESSTNTDLRLGTNSTSRLTIGSSGNVSVAAPTSGVALAVTAAAGQYGLVINQATTTAGIYCSNASGSFTLQAGGGSSQFYTNGAWGLDIGVNNATVISIGNTGVANYLSNEIGFRDVPQNSQTASYTLVLADRGKHISITTGGVVIPANSATAFPIGTVVSVFNDSTSNQTISINTDTLRLAGTSSVGSRTLALYGIATLLKVSSTTWVISGTGVT